MKHLNKKHKFLISMVQYFISLIKLKKDFIDELSEYVGKFFEAFAGLILYLVTAPIFLPISLVCKILDKYNILHEVWSDYSNYRKQVKVQDEEKQCN